MQIDDFTTKFERKIQRRWMIAIGAVVGFVVLVMALIVIAVVNMHKTTTVELVVAPSFADITANGKKIASGGERTIKYYPGNYEIEIVADGFHSQKMTMNFEDNGTTHIYTYLEPTDDNADFYDLEENKKEYDLAQMAMDKQAILSTEEYAEKYPITNVLPYWVEDYNEFGRPQGFRIDYGEFEGCETDFCLQVTAYKRSGLERAKEYIKEKGFNPDDFEILFNYQPVEALKPEDFPEGVRQSLIDSGFFEQEEM